jgi:hypothetical protein
MKYAPKARQGSGPRPSGSTKRVKKPMQSKKSVGNTGMHQPTAKVR